MAGCPETTWGSRVDGADPFKSGSAALTLVYEGNTPVHSATGAMSGFGKEPHNSRFGMERLAIRR